MCLCDAVCGVAPLTTFQALLAPTATQVLSRIYVQLLQWVAGEELDPPVLVFLPRTVPVRLRLCSSWPHML